MPLSVAIALEPVSMIPRLTEHSGDLLLCACGCANIGVTVDGKGLRWSSAVDSTRKQDRAGVHRRRPKGQGSPLWPQWAAAGPPVPHSGAASSADVGAVRSLFQPYMYITQMYK